MSLRPPTKESILRNFEEELEFIEGWYQDEVYDIERDRDLKIRRAERERDEALAALANESNEEEAR